MTKDTWRDLWVQEKGHYTFTIEHVLPQGRNLPNAWVEMLGGPASAAAAQEAHLHRLGNLTITAYNSALGNKSFIEKRDRTDSEGRSIGYRNGFVLNAGLVAKDSWATADIDARTDALASRVIGRFPLRSQAERSITRGPTLVRGVGSERRFVVVRRGRAGVGGSAGIGRFRARAVRAVVVRTAGVAVA
jgi:hypothetical protein